MTADEFHRWYCESRESLEKRTFASANRRCGATREDAEDAVAETAVVFLTSASLLARILGDPFRVILIKTADEIPLKDYFVLCATRKACREAKKRNMNGKRKHPELLEEIAGCNNSEANPERLDGIRTGLANCWSKLEPTSQSLFQRKYCPKKREGLLGFSRNDRTILGKARKNFYRCLLENGVQTYELLYLNGELLSLICGDPPFETPGSFAGAS